MKRFSYKDRGWKNLQLIYHSSHKMFSYGSFDGIDSLKSKMINPKSIEETFDKVDVLSVKNKPDFWIHLRFPPKVDLDILHIPIRYVELKNSSSVMEHLAEAIANETGFTGAKEEV